MATVTGNSEVANRPGLGVRGEGRRGCSVRLGPWPPCLLRRAGVTTATCPAATRGVCECALVDRGHRNLAPLARSAHSGPKKRSSERCASCAAGLSIVTSSRDGAITASPREDKKCVRHAVRRHPARRTLRSGLAGRGRRDARSARRWRRPAPKPVLADAPDDEEQGSPARAPPRSRSRCATEIRTPSSMRRRRRFEVSRRCCSAERRATAAAGGARCVVPGRRRRWTWFWVPNYPLTPIPAAAPESGAARSASSTGGHVAEPFRPMSRGGAPRSVLGGEDELALSTSTIRASGRDEILCDRALAPRLVVARIIAGPGSFRPRRSAFVAGCCLFGWLVRARRAPSSGTVRYRRSLERAPRCAARRDVEFLRHGAPRRRNDALTVTNSFVSAISSVGSAVGPLSSATRRSLGVS